MNKRELANLIIGTGLIVLFFIIFSSTMSNADSLGQTWLSQIDIYTDHPPQRNTALCPPVTLQSVRSGLWNSPSTWDEGRVPSTTDVVLVMNDNFIDGPTDTTVQALCNYGVIRSLANESLRIVATGFISNNGKLEGRDGESGSGQTCGTSGGSIELSGSVPISNSGRIYAGRGGDGEQCAGNGGSVYILSRNTTNKPAGRIYGGGGGNLTGNITDTIAGRGGDVELWGSWGAPGDLINQGYIAAGNGGNANQTAVVRQHGGCGGDVRLMSQPIVRLDGSWQQAGWDGRGVNGGNNGCRGRIAIDPGLISLNGPSTMVLGGDVLIYGGDDWILDLGNMSAGAISATGSITLAVGPGGAIDLSGGAGQVLQAAGQVMIASDIISANTSLATLAGTNVVTKSGQILRDVSVSGPGLAVVRPGRVKTLNFTVLNGSPAQDTYTSTTTNVAGWSVTDPPLPLTVPGLNGQALTVHLTVPQSAADGERNTLTLTLTSSGQIKTQRVEILVELEKIYLPLIIKK